MGDSWAPVEMNYSFATPELNSREIKELCYRKEKQIIFYPLSLYYFFDFDFFFKGWVSFFSPIPFFGSYLSLDQTLIFYGTWRTVFIFLDYSVKRDYFHIPLDF